MGFNNCVDEQFDNIYKNNFKEMNEGTLIYFNGKISNNKFVDYVVLGIMISGHYDSYKELFNKLNVNGDICINSLKEEYEFKKEYSKKEDDEE